MNRPSPSADERAAVRLFVYGTLRRGEANRFAADLHAHSTPAGRGRMRGRLYACGWFPALVPSRDPADVVHGDVLVLDDRTAAEVLARMDEYEGPQFERREADVEMEGGETVRCQVYLYRGDVEGRERIASGDWLARGAQRS